MNIIVDIFHGKNNISVNILFQIYKCFATTINVVSFINIKLILKTCY